MLYLLLLFLTFLILTVLYVYLTNPFRHVTIVKNPYKFSIQNNEIILQRIFPIKVKNRLLDRLIAYIKCGSHIIKNAQLASHKAKSKDIDGIIRDIHSLRFNPAKPYLISGDHFSVLYPRNLGTFYHCLLDPRTPLSEEDWQNRQVIYLKSTLYALGTFIQAGLYTTLVPAGRHSVTPVNIYSYPSDALYGVLYALSTMVSSSQIKQIYQISTDKEHLLNTTKYVNGLLGQCKNDMKQLLDRYIETVFDTSTGLIRKDIHLSSAKDITMRQCAFYDNVILWKTRQLADQLGIQPVEKGELDNYKKCILETFWSKDGYFLEDLSAESVGKNYYSSDWLVALFTGFLDAKNVNELPYFERSVAYIKKERIDKPFGLKYQQTDRKSRQFPLVRFFLPEYGGSAIWSFWGNEYIKLLIILYRETGKKEYLTDAKEQLDAYRNNIIRYRGFPEVYNSQGEMLKTPFYRSVLQTGWIINFEQAEKMYLDVIKE